MNWFLVIAAGILLTGSQALALPIITENLLPNPGFEAGMDSKGAPKGWRLARNTATITADTPKAAAKSGTAGLCITSTNRKGWSYVACSGMPVASGDEISFEALYRTSLESSVKDSLRMSLVIYGGPDGGVLLRKVQVFDPQAEWTKASMSIVAPMGATSAEVQFNLAEAVGKAFFDDASLTVQSSYSIRIANPEPYAGRQALKVKLTNRTALSESGELRLRVNDTETKLPIKWPRSATGEFSIPAEFPKGGRYDYTLDLLNASGDVQRTLTGRFTIPEPLQMLVACPQYHCVGEGNGATEVCVEANLSPQERMGAKLTLSLRDSAGKELRRLETNGIKDRYVARSFVVPVTQPGDFTARAELSVSGKPSPIVSETDIHVIPREEATVRVGDDGYLRIKGRTIFSLGMYQSARLPEMAKAGFNTTHVYVAEKLPLLGNPRFEQQRTKEFLDDSAKNGMRGILGLYRDTVQKGDWESIRRRILTFRNHPGLLAWGEEEGVARGNFDLDTLRKLSKMVKELDPNHPFLVGDTYAMSWQVTDCAHQFPEDLMDIGIWWWYPLPLDADPEASRPEYAGPGGLEMKYPAWLDQIATRKPFWAAVQTYAKGNPVVFPTPDQRRCNTYLSIIRGSKGILFYTGSGEVAADGKPGGIFNRPEEGNWDELKQYISQLQELNPVLTAPDSKSKIRVEAPGNAVLFRAKAPSGKMVLIAANRGPDRVKARFMGEDLRGSVNVRFENRQLPVTQGAFEDEFAPYGTHVYELK